MKQVLIKGGQIYGHGNADILITDNYIEKVAPNIVAPENASSISARDCIIYPGFVNTHHHLTQSLAKAVPSGINSPLGDWLVEVPYKLWPKLTPEIVYTSAMMGFYELIRSGTTTCADHFYIYHRDFNMEMEEALYQAADDTGIRFVHCRGGSTHIGSHTGQRHSAFTLEDSDLYLNRVDQARKKFHQNTDDAMRKLVIAPTTIVHTNPPADLKMFASYAREHGLRMHTHMLEVDFDEEMAQQHYGMSAIDFAESVGWLGDDVWFAHCVKADKEAIAKMAATGTGVSHCPTSNCRLGSGIASIPNMQQAGVPISLGVDGSASSESASMLNEMMQAWLIHRPQSGATATPIDQVLHWASAGGARILGYDRLGTIAPGMLADLTIIDMDQPRLWGVWEKQHAPVVCGEPLQIKFVFVNGRCILENNALSKFDIHSLKERANNALSSLQEN